MATKVDKTIVPCAVDALPYFNFALGYNKEVQAVHLETKWENKVTLLENIEEAEAVLSCFLPKRIQGVLKALYHGTRFPFMSQEVTLQCGDEPVPALAELCEKETEGSASAIQFTISCKSIKAKTVGMELSLRRADNDPIIFALPMPKAHPKWIEILFRVARTDSSQ